MTKEELQKALASHERWLNDKPDGARLDLSGRDLQDADLRGANLDKANLRYAYLNGADLRDASLWHADLQGAILCHANLYHASMTKANLKGASLNDADLHYAYLTGADLRGADLYGVNLGSATLDDACLQGADLDYATLPLWCGSLNIKIDKRLAAQLLYHALRAMQSCADEPDVAAVLASESCLKLANQFHRVDECGAIEPLKQEDEK